MSKSFGVKSKEVTSETISLTICFLLFSIIKFLSKKGGQNEK